MSTHTIPYFSNNKETHPKLFLICSYGIFSKGLKNEFETAMVNEPSVFEPLKVFYNRNVCAHWCKLFISNLLSENTIRRGVLSTDSEIRIGEAVLLCCHS